MFILFKFIRVNVVEFAQEHGGRSKEHDEFYRIAGITREQIRSQRSPQGSGAPDLEIVSIETNNPANTFKFATSNHPWAVRFRDYAKKASFFTIYWGLI